MSSGLLVIGSGPGGLAAAVAYREAGGDGPVRIVTADPHPPYDRPPLSKEVLRGEKEPSFLHRDGFYAEHGITVTTGTEVTSIDPDGHTVTTADGEEIAYAALVLATGSTPVVPPVDGAEHPGLVFLRSLDDGTRLRDTAGDARSAIVVGSGFIGCEAAMSLRARGLEVTLISQESLPQVDRLGVEVAGRLATWLRTAGVALVGGTSVKRIEGGHTVVTADDVPYAADLVLLATGARPASDLAGGLATEGGRVVVDSAMRTSAADVYAVGDVAYAENAAAGRHLVVEHWDDADAMGTVAGHVAAGRDERWAAVPGFWSQVGEEWLNLAAWGDGWDEVVFRSDGDAFTAWYVRDGAVVGVLTHDTDELLDLGRELIVAGGPVPD